MKNKVFKYIKFLISMVLILGLVAPSYASLSASDGSAFVTKAEFDSALADFNSRLTSFEAGINSKIDSQVTTYLDRNGIWNGAHVDFVDISNEKMGLEEDVGGQTWWVYSYGSNPGGNGLIGGGTAWSGNRYVNNNGFTIKPRENKELIILESVPKTGLLMFTLDRIYDAMPKYGTRIFPSMDWFLMNMGCSLIVSMEIRDVSTGKTLFQDPLSWTWSTGTSLTETPTSSNYQFFVSKDHTLKVYLKTTQKGDYSNWLFVGDDGENLHYYLSWNLREGAIY